MIVKILPGGIYKEKLLEGSAAGAFLYISAGRIVKILYGEFGCTTDATVANRVYTIGILNETPLRILPLYKITVAASLTKLIALGTSTPANTEVDDSIILPPELLLDENMKLDVALVDGQAGDTWYLRFKYLEWIDA
ncbi:unnamed protein product [marine sediment metagenome]|uniref:Uncharacterized protein n=1 Tax=marine sediment metagenome TaxID=412755 RepID=X1L5Z4_9ZZZZ